MTKHSKPTRFIDSGSRSTSNHAATEVRKAKDWDRSLFDQLAERSPTTAKKILRTVKDKIGKRKS